MKSWKKLVFLIILLIVALYLIVPMLFPGSLFNCWIERVDINSGKYWYERYIFGLKVQNDIKDTAISKIFAQVSLDVGQPEWRLVRIGMPVRGNEPVNTYSGIFDMLRNLEEAFDLAKFDDMAKRVALENIFRIVKEDESSARATKYSQMIRDTARGIRGGTMLVDYLPPAPPKDAVN